jgi:hypothetical protein
MLAGELDVQVTEEEGVGTENPGAQVSTYGEQGRLQDAEEPGVQVMETRKRALGAGISVR